MFENSLFCIRHTNPVFDNKFQLLINSIFDRFITGVALMLLSKAGKEFSIIIPFRRKLNETGAFVPERID